MKVCRRCNKQKQKSEFRPAKHGILQSWCKQCEADYQREIYANNPSKQRARRSRYMERYRDKYNASRRSNRRNSHIAESARKYKTTKVDIENLLRIRNCEICRKAIAFGSKNVHLRPNIDHNHITGKLRGLLCGYCNNLLGRCDDNVVILNRAIKYLNERR
jgi:hypothetical protein